MKPETRYYWQVTVWDQDGNPCRTSDVASFELGKGENADWQAKWITDDKDKEYEPAPMFRKGFMVDKPVKQARLYVSAAGYYEMFLNGKRVGENFLDPGYTHFDKRNLYVTHDVTSLLQKGNKLTLTYDNLYMHSFPLYSEALGSESDYVVPTQFSHNLTLSYSLQNGRYNFSVECRNFTNEKLYDNFSLQKAGRAFYGKIRICFGN